MQNNNEEALNVLMFVQHFLNPNLSNTAAWSLALHFKYDSVSRVRLATINMLCPVKLAVVNMQHPFVQKIC